MKLTASSVRGGDESGHVSHDAAANRDDDRFAIRPQMDHLLPQLVGCVDGLACFTGFENQHVYVGAGFGQGLGDGNAVQRVDVGVGNDDRVRQTTVRRDEVRRLAQ